MSTDDRIKQALTCIDKALDSINTNESWLEYLRFQSLFYRYSAQNTMLIYSQRPEASFVMGYKSWNKIGRYVVKGSQAIKILAPCYKKVDSIVEPKDDNKYFDAEAEHEIKKVLSGFKVANVFDIQDTAGDDSRLPILITGLKGDTEEIRKIYEWILFAVSKEHKVVMVERTASKGSYNLETEVISVRSDLEPLALCKTLLHEWSHAINFRQFPDDKISRNQRELIAESSAYIVALRLSLDTSAYSFPYIKSWLKSKDEIKEIADATQKAAYEIIMKLASSEGALFNLQED